MMTGDYAVYNSKIVKITSNSYDVVDANGKSHRGVDLKESNITINEDVLLVCGFTQNPENKNEFKYHIDDKNLDIVGTVFYDIYPFPNKCRINFSIHSKMLYTSKEIMVLSELQDFVRINTNQELTVDFERLIEVARI